MSFSHCMQPDPRPYGDDLIAPSRTSPDETRLTNLTLWRGESSAQDSARVTVTKRQAWVMCGIALGVIQIVVWVGLLLSMQIMVALMTLLYLVDLSFNAWIARGSLVTSQPARSRLDVRSTWPTYTVLCPVFREAAVLPQFVAAMQQLDYPVDRLQILLLLEQDDDTTLVAAREANLPPHFEIIIVPKSFPRTKPKACNYGLARASGQFCVIFDAEDVPETDQLMKAALAFSIAPGNMACYQAPLNFYNPRQNTLTRLFTAEYSLWFDLTLVGLQRLAGPIPLGGTSNHFRTDILRGLGGWDSFNVTEDCDLGIRLYIRVSGLECCIAPRTRKPTRSWGTGCGNGAVGSRGTCRPF